MSDLIDRLRGIYRVPITDGLGAVGGGDEPDNPNEFVRSFPVPPIHREAATEIERLTAECKALREDRDEYCELLRIEHVMATAQNGIVNSLWDILGRDETSEDGSNLVGRVKQLADRATAAAAELASACALLAQYEQAPVVGWYWWGRTTMMTWPIFDLGMDRPMEAPDTAVPLIARPEPSK